MGTYVNQSTPLHIQPRRADRLMEVRGEERQRARQALAEILATTSLRGAPATVAAIFGPISISPTPSVPVASRISTSIAGWP